ncbi:YoaK family protein [Ramlibacter sp. AN1133]|uniref:YoaK family protein n=1 Tax=Ramlibacter sp. AN1133 TaxID=3133429 RepID=UPI0030BE2013
MKDRTVLHAPARQPLAERLLAGAAMAAVAGWVDTIGFIGLHGVFTAHVTGNFVLLGTGLAGDGSEFAAKLLVLPAFVAGVAGAASMHAFQRGRTAPLLWFQLAALACFLLAGARTTTVLAACAGAFAMGVQNAHCRLSSGALGATTAMTGNVTQLVLDVLGAAGVVPSDRAEARRRLFATLVPVAGFAAGCAGGGLAGVAWSFWALLVPIATLAVLALLACKR